MAGFVITKIHRGGKSVRKLLDYCLKKDQQPEIIGGTMSGHNARELSREFAHSRSASAHLTHPVMHWSISYQQADIAAGLTAEKRGAIAQEVFKRHLEDDWEKVNAQRERRGLPSLEKPDVAQWDFVVIRHGAAEHKQNPHDHIVAIRANRDGQIYHGKFNRMAAVRIDRECEQQFQLEKIPARDRQTAPHKVQPRDRAGYIAQQRNLTTDKDRIAHEAQRILASLAEEQRSLDAYAAQLERQGLQLSRDITEQGRERYYIGLMGGKRWRADRLGLKGSSSLDHLSRNDSHLPIQPTKLRDRSL
jgi:hypothetical protein